MTKLFDVNIKEKHLIGVEISRSYSCVVLCDLKLKVMAGERLFVPIDKYYPEIVIGEIVKTSREFLEKFSIPQKNILGTGLGVTGPVYRKTGHSDEVYGFSVDAWSNIPICNMLEQVLLCISLQESIMVFFVIALAYKSCRAGAISCANIHAGKPASV